MNEEEYQKWSNDKTINPKTKRKLKFGTRTYKKIQKLYEDYDLTKEIITCHSCFNDVDPITLEKFEDKEQKYKLIMINKQNNKFHCYETSSFVKYIIDGNIKDPLDPSYTITQEDLKQVETKMNFPNKTKNKLPTFKLELLIINIDIFFQILILRKKKIVIDCGFFPSYIFIDENVNSFEMIHKVITLWNKSKLISYNPLRCCLEEFCQQPEYWFRDNTLDIEKFKAFDNKLNELLL